MAGPSGRGAGVGLVIGGICSVQVGAAIAKGLFGIVDPITLVWLRLSLGSLILLAVARPRLQGRSARDWGTAVAYGTALATMNVCLYQAIARIPLGTAVTIEFLGPLTVAVLGSRRLRDWLWVALAGAGVAILGLFPSDLDPVGVGFALAAAAAWGTYIVMSRLTGARWPGISGLTVGSTVGALAVTLLMVTLAKGQGLDRPHVWLVGLGVALLSSVVPYSLEMLALRRIRPAVFGILMSLEPAAAAFAAMLILHEFLRPADWIAVACVMIASIGSVRGARPDGPATPVIPAEEPHPPQN